MKYGKIPLIIALVLIAVLATTTAVFALTVTKAVPVNVEIVGGTKDLSVYVYPSTVPASALNLSQFQRGTTQDIQMQVKNTGTETLNESVRVNPATVSWGTLTLSKTALGSLGPGGTADFVLTVTVLPAATSGNVTFTLEFYEP